MPIRSLLFLLTVVCVLASRSAAADSDIIVERDIPYLGEDRAEKLDVYSPPRSFERPRPAVVVIHGGGWFRGDKASSREKNFGRTLAAEGYLVFSVNYKLNTVETGLDGKNTATKLAWPQNFYDCKTAVRFTRKEAERFGADPKRIAVMGGSAGGHLALLVGSTANVEQMNSGGLYTDQSNAISCIIDFYGVADVTGPKRSPLFAVGKTDEENRLNARLATPLTWMGADTPPILIVHGTADSTVPISVSRELVTKLKAMGIEHEYVEVSDAPHSFDLEPTQQDLRPLVLQFLKKHL